MTSTALSPPLLTVASGNTHPSPGRAAGNMAITFSPVELYFPGQPHTKWCWYSLWRLFLTARILKMCLVVSTWGDVHLIVWGCEQTLGDNVQVLFPPWADGISSPLQRPPNVFVKCWIRLFQLSTVTSKSVYLIYPLLCLNRECGRLIMEAQISLWNNKQCRLIATVPATEQKRFFPKICC